MVVLTMGYGFTRPTAGGMLTTMASIGENIRTLREKAGYKTQGAFAEALGVPQPRLSDWENDRYGAPELPNLLRIAKKLNVSLEALIEGVDHEYDLSRNAPADVIQQGAPEFPTSSSPEARRETDPTLPSSLPIRPSSVRTSIAIAHDLRAHAHALSALARDVMRIPARGGTAAITPKKTRRSGNHPAVHRRTASGGGGRKR
jgi:transcriptional regulator with XRE-family HTH domain